MNTKKTIIFLIILLAFFLRVWKVGEYPVSLYGDEQSFAWNAWSILKTGADEYGTSYPLQFRAFNDYKAPVPVYMLVPVFALFGMTPTSIRIPIALSSVMTVGALYFLSRRFFNCRASLLIAYTAAVSTWGIHLSRGYFESTLALFFLAAGLYYFLGNKTRDSVFSAVFFALSIYTYFTPRIFLILMLPLLLVWKWKTSKDKNSPLKKMGINFIILFLICIPLLYQTFFGKGFTRFSKLMEGLNSRVVQTVSQERYTSSLSPDVTRKLVNKVTVAGRFILQGYLEHFSFNYYFISADSSLRYFTGDRGLLYLFELPFLITGLYVLWKNKRSVSLFIFIWLLITPIPGAIVGRPFAVRSLAMAPPLWITIGYGIYAFSLFLKKRPARSVFLLLLPLIVSVSLGGWLIRYYYFYPKLGATWWGGINKSAIDMAVKEEDKYDYIFLSDYYTGMPLAYAVYAQIDPLEYRKALANPVVLADGRHLIKLGKFYFGSLDINEKRMREAIIPPHSLYFARPEELKTGTVITAPDDGRILFYVYRT